MKCYLYVKTLIDIMYKSNVKLKTLTKMYLTSIFCKLTLFVANATESCAPYMNVSLKMDGLNKFIDRNIENVYVCCIFVVW